MANLRHEKATPSMPRMQGYMFRMPGMQSYMFRSVSPKPTSLGLTLLVPSPLTNDATSSSSNSLVLTTLTSDSGSTFKSAANKGRKSWDDSRLCYSPTRIWRQVHPRIKRRAPKYGLTDKIMTTTYNKSLSRD
jgi:hypothetical protein